MLATSKRGGEKARMTWQCGCAAVAVHSSLKRTHRMLLAGSAAPLLWMGLDRLLVGQQHFDFAHTHCPDALMLMVRHVVPALFQSSTRLGLCGWALCASPTAV